MQLSSAAIQPGQPCVAVVVPAYNAERTIAAAVQSALAEPEVAELVVVDDGSTDATGDVARSCDDGTRRLLVVRQSNQGPSAACNRGIALTRAPLWTVLDADDVFAPGRLGSLLQRAGADWDLAADPILFRFRLGGEHRMAPDRPVQSVTLESFVRGNIPQRKAKRCELGYLQPLMRRQFFDRHGLQFDGGVRFAEDYMLYASALAKGARFLWTTGPGYVVNVTPGSLSHTQGPDDYNLVIAFDESLLQGRTPAEAAALREHIAMMRLKERYLRIERELDLGRKWHALRLALASPDTTKFVFDHRWRPRFSRAVKRAAGLDPDRELMTQLFGG